MVKLIDIGSINIDTISGSEGNGVGDVFNIRNTSTEYPGYIVNKLRVDSLKINKVNTCAGYLQGVRHVEFGDFDVETRTIYIQRQITSNPVVSKGGSEIQSYEVIEKPPKTDNSYRRLRIPEAIAEEIEKRRAVVEANKLQYGEQYFDHDYISCQENGLPHSMAAMNGVLTRLCARNGLPHITVHGLRHMYATILIEMKVPLIKISALLGHASVNTTFEYYCEVMDENEQIITFMNHTFVPEGGVAIC